MNKKQILIDATYAEQIRLAVVEGDRLENYDQEIASNRTYKGNIYLAKVTRVEPSLQACFVDYGKERHGFLSLAEIHPDYYRIPVADKKALMEDLYREQEQWNEERPQKYKRDDYQDQDKNMAKDYRPPHYKSNLDDLESMPPLDVMEQENPATTADDNPDSAAPDPMAEMDEEESNMGLPEKKSTPMEEPMDDEEEDNEDANDTEDEDMDDEEEGNEDKKVARNKMSHFLKRRRYKIQEVIKKGQVILVQVVKDERGQKGAAMTSYISLAGRYCVIMPNATKGGGISRKINFAQRDRLRDISRSLNIPQGIGLIIRTAGADRSEAEIKTDYDYVSKLWDHIRELTISSTAPMLIYEEGSLIKKAIRNYNNSTIDEIWVEGEEAYQIAKETIEAIAPEEANKLKKFVPGDHANRSIFNHYDIEYEIQSIYEPYVPLRSGGVLVINQTEALVAIDVNSGKAIRERNIEETALRTNLEAAAEVARQLRLRDLSGQIVIDFIDMEYNRNIYQVEKFFREQLRKDRARVQVGRIGMFGMLEMTRQRLRPSITETVMQECPHCRGTGKNFRPEYYSLQFLREMFHLIQEKGPGRVVAEVPNALAHELLQNKKDKIKEIRDTYHVDVEFVELSPQSLEPYIINYSKGSKAPTKGRASKKTKEAPLNFLGADK